MTDADPLYQRYSFTYFNELTLFGRSGSAQLDHLKIRDQANTKHNLIFKMVLSDIKTLNNWVEFYGMNFVETMGLEFSNYLLMVKELTQYNAKAQSGTDKMTADILSGKSRMGGF